MLVTYPSSQPSPSVAGPGARSRCCCGCRSRGTWRRHPCGKSSRWSAVPGTRLKAWGGSAPSACLWGAGHSMGSQQARPGDQGGLQGTEGAQGSLSPFLCSPGPASLELGAMHIP